MAGEFTFAGAFDDSFDNYAEQLRAHLPGAIVAPLTDDQAPDEGHFSSPFFGTVGAFSAPRAISSSLGPFDPDYGGNVPVSAQPQLKSVDPWEADE